MRSSCSIYNLGDKFQHIYLSKMNTIHKKIYTHFTKMKELLRQLTGLAMACISSVTICMCVVVQSRLSQAKFNLQGQQKLYIAIYIITV